MKNEISKVMEANFTSLSHLYFVYFASLSLRENHRITQNWKIEKLKSQKNTRENFIKFHFSISTRVCSPTDSIESNQEGGAMLIESTSNADGYIPNSSLFEPWADSPTQVKIQNSVKKFCGKFQQNFYRREKNI